MVLNLMVLLGEVLSSGKIKIEGKITKNLKALATIAFDGVLSEKLETKAKTLDNRIFELRKKHNIRSAFNKFKDFVSLEELEEIRNITKINRAIFDILDAAKWRHEVLEDLLWIISGEESPKSSEELPKLSLIAYVDNYEYISYLNKQFQQATSN
ncbi:unnamed protein product [Rhizophagus irregularis]|nr:unnamed protein product [Rhizophagus irregularis]